MVNKLVQKINSKIEEKGSRKTIENLIFFVIILVVTVIFINYIWGGNRSNKGSSEKSESDRLVINNLEGGTNIRNVEVSNNSLEFQIENILKKLDGVGDVSVLITYEETSQIIPMYNEDIAQSITEETDNQGGVRTINENSSKREVIYEESGGEKSVVTSKVVSPKIKGAIVMAKGADNINVKSNIIQAVEAATGLPTHKIQVFQMK